jgi:hypothetical protein
MSPRWRSIGAIPASLSDTSDAGDTVRAHYTPIGCGVIEGFRHTQQIVYVASTGGRRIRTVDMSPLFISSPASMCCDHASAVCAQNL